MLRSEETEEVHKLVRYQQFTFICAGGGGRVYRALDAAVGVEVAIKILHSGLDRMKMMRREVYALRAFSHPNIVKLLDITMIGDEPAMVLELAGKGELSQYLQHPLSVRLALSLARQLADALRVIHEAGRVHGDIKPANIFVNASGTLKLGDFGLGNAKGCTILFSAIAGGTPGYVAPEVALGYSTTPAADVYSLAVTLFEMLTARRPASLCGTGVSPGILRLERFRQDIPEGLANLIARSTSNNPRLRPTAIEFRASLDQIVGFLREADAWRERKPTLRILRAKVRPLGKGMRGLHGLPHIVRGEYFDFVTHSPWHPDHRLQCYHAASGVSGPVPQKIGQPFGPSVAIPAARTIRVFMGNPPHGGELFSLDPADQSGFDYKLFLGSGHILRDDGADAIFLVDARSGEVVDLGVYDEIPETGGLLLRVILQQYLPSPTARPVGLPIVRALPAP
jgi:Protein kinase domain